jgi:hypothetical protein
MESVNVSLKPFSSPKTGLGALSGDTVAQFGACYKVEASIASADNLRYGTILRTLAERVNARAPSRSLVASASVV